MYQKSRYPLAIRLLLIQALLKGSQPVLDLNKLLQDQDVRVLGIDPDRAVRTLNQLLNGFVLVCRQV